MTFLQLMQLLEGRLGTYQLPINPECKDLRGLFETCALHHDLALRLARDIYRANTCRHPGDRVARGPTLTAVIPIRLEVLGALSTDIDVFHFIENFCEGIEQALQPVRPVVAAPTETTPATGNIVPFSRPRARLA